MADDLGSHVSSMTIRFIGIGNMVYDPSIEDFTSAYEYAILQTDQPHEFRYGLAPCPFGVPKGLARTSTKTVQKGSVIDHLELDELKARGVKIRQEDS